MRSTRSGSDSEGFIKKLDDTLKEGESDVEKGRKMFKKDKKKKRDRDQANEASTEEGLKTCTSKNDPNLILNKLPRETSAALRRLQPNMMEVCLTGYLSRHVDMLSEVGQMMVRTETTQYEKFVALVDAMKEEGIQFERQIHF